MPDIEKYLIFKYSILKISSFSIFEIRYSIFSFSSLGGFALSASVLSLSVLVWRGARARERLLRKYPSSSQYAHAVFLPENANASAPQVPLKALARATPLHRG